MSDLAGIISQVRERLVDYLVMQGRAPDKRGKFLCPVPEHGDTNPSATILRANPQVWCCPVCGAKGSIFHAAEHLEGLPIRGTEFITVTLKSLTERLGIHFEVRPPTKEELIEQSRTILLTDVGNFLATKGSHELAAERSWTTETCRELGIGTVGFGSVEDYLLSKGHTKDAIDDAGISERLFFPEGLTFTLYSPGGVVVGFATRNTTWEPHSQSPKYFNTPGLSKKSLLYNVHQSRRSVHELWLVEGYACVVTAWQAGIRNVCAVAGVAVSDEQVDLLSSMGFSSVVLALDSEPNHAGENGVKRALEGPLAGRQDIRARVADLGSYAVSTETCQVGQLRKPGHCDLDELIRMKCGLPSDIPIYSAFEWLLRTSPGAKDPEQLCQDMLPVLIAERSHIHRDQMSASLAKTTGVRKEAIDREIDSILRKEDHEQQIKLDAIRESAIRQLKQSNSMSMQEVMERSISKIQTLRDSAQPAARFAISETVSATLKAREDYQKPKGRLRGLKSGQDFFDRVTLGLPKAGRVMAVAGQPNAGKSAWVNGVAWDSLDKNPDSQHRVFHMTIDDVRDVVLTRQVARDAKVDSDIVTMPEMASKSQIEAIDNSWERLLWFIEHKRYDIKDSSHGTTLEFLEDWLAFAHNETPDVPFLVILDNLHKLEGDSSDLRTKFLQASAQLQRIKNNPRLGRPAILTTVELIKTHGREPGVFDIAETNKILYDVDLVLILHSQFIGSGEDSTDFWIGKDTDSRPVKLPMVKVNCEKNKISGTKGHGWFKMTPGTGIFEEEKHYIPGQNIALDPNRE